MNKQVDFDQYAGNYDDLLRQGTGFFSKDDEYFARYKVRLAQKLVDRPVKRLLEFGCGTGRNIALLREAFRVQELVGTDVSAASLAVARAAHPETDFRVEGGVEAAGLSGFDCVFVAGVFHHVPEGERASVAATLRERMATESDLIVFEHNPFNPVTRRIVSQCPFDADAVLLAPSQLRQLLETAGLRTMSQGYCLFVPPAMKWLQWLEPRLARLPLGGQYFIHASK